MNSGRKPDDVNLKIIERLTPLDDKAFEMLKQGIENGDFKFIRLYFEMRWGKARQMTELTVTNSDPPPLFNLINFTTREENK